MGVYRASISLEVTRRYTYRNCSRSEDIDEDIRGQN